MHPLLTDTRREVCKEFVEALEACHASPFKKYTGQCNGIKHELNMCLRHLRVETAEKNRAEARLRKQKFEDSMKENEV
ncbi:UPF0287-domain-containing protein [Exidia glandulosa HHB12029]|uniref:COX assembly mitochondrial protein n=1 Tax=Exidia glandulosa HHB12029 TaxID=1314781 RepID=A0A165DWM7_EXIGL|nr:UPF0287-domain-containing protein [Exidia glandulosa HHB12029]